MNSSDHLSCDAFLGLVAKRRGTYRGLPALCSRFEHPTILGLEVNCRDARPYATLRILSERCCTERALASKEQSAKTC